MQLTKSSLLLLATVAPLLTSLADSVPFVTAFYGDFQANLLQYISYIGAGGSVPPVLFSLYSEVSTYTDDSYTTLIGSDFPIDQLSEWVTGLPWYSTRLSAEIAEAAATSTGAASSSLASATSAAATSSSAVPTSSVSSVVSSAASSASSAALESSSSAEASSSAAPTASSSPSSGAAANIVNPLVLAPLVALSAGALLL